MEFWKTIIGLLRQRTIVVPIIAISVFAAVLGYVLVPPHYVSSATSILVIPSNGGTLSEDANRPVGLTNPLLAFTSSLKTTVGILALVMHTTEVSEELSAGAGDTTVTIVDGTTAPELLGADGPFIYIKGDSTSSPADARDVVVRAQDRLRVELADRQKELNAPPITYITMIDVVPVSAPVASHTNQLKAASAALVIALLGGAGVAYGAARKRNSRGDHQDEEEQPTEVMTVAE